jgi:predicted nucleic acid-binding Zn ribbon protein
VSDGTLETVDGRPALRFERVLAHPVERVWRAVSVPEIDFVEGEELRTEVSATFTRPGLETELAAAGLRLARWWTDPAGDYALSLALPNHPVVR